MNNFFHTNIVKLYGQKGQAWLEDLEKLVERFSQKWNLSNLLPMSNLSYNYVLGGMQNDKHVILKLGLDKIALQKEANALSCFDGHGCVKLIDSDLNFGALLLQRVVPGTTLKNFFPDHDLQATKIACQVIKNLQTISLQESKNFPNISKWLSVFDKNWDIPKNHLDKARALSKQLLSTTTKSVLLHGDLHHENILSSGDSWVAIDPHGVVGDPTYEVGAFIRNPIPDLLECDNAKEIIQKRISTFAKELNFDEQRIKDWSYVQAVLAVCWAIEDNLDPKYFLKFLEDCE